MCQVLEGDDNDDVVACVWCCCCCSRQRGENFPFVLVPTAAAAAVLFCFPVWLRCSTLMDVLLPPRNAALKKVFYHPPSSKRTEKHFMELAAYRRDRRHIGDNPRRRRETFSSPESFSRSAGLSLHFFPPPPPSFFPHPQQNRDTAVTEAGSGERFFFSRLFFFSRSCLGVTITPWQRRRLHVGPFAAALCRRKHTLRDVATTK